MRKRILIADDEEIVIRSCLRILSEEKYNIETVNNGLEAIEKIAENEYDMLILDIMMPKMTGMEVLQRVKETHPDVDVIMITGLNQIETAVEAMKLGAFDYLPKPFDPEELELVVERAFERRQLLQENVHLKKEVSARYSFENIIGSSPPMQNVYRLIARCAPTNSTAMLRGESGTGKELIARAIHFNSLRKDKPFVTVDCASLSENLLESELFLDEIGNISMSTQAKLLRFIQEKEFKAVGDTQNRSVNLRLITATNKDLEGMVTEGTFRDDLYYRINIFPIEIPPLRERRDDIPALAFHFLSQFSKEMDRKVTEFSAGAMNLLMNHDWPGNVRELENVIHRAVILTSDDIIRQAHLVNILDMQPLVGMGVPRTSEELKNVKKVARQKSVENIEKLFILGALKRNGWSVTASAEETGMQRSNFQALMKKYDIRIRGTGPAENP